jgi:hypothetical protein
MKQRLLRKLAENELVRMRRKWLWPNLMYCQHCLEGLKKTKKRLNLANQNLKCDGVSKKLSTVTHIL